MSDKNSKKAVIVGSGIAGLISAKVASEYYQEVIVIERDSKPVDACPRKGVPQGHHIHVLLNKGEQILEEFFPGIRKALVSQGAVTRTLGKDVKWYLSGHWMPTFDEGFVTFFQTRPLLEKIIRDFVEKIDNISFRYETKLEHYNFDENSGAVQSAAFIDLATKTSFELSAELFLDATGRGSQLTKLIEKQGYSKIPESQVGVDFAYSSGMFEVSENTDKNDAAILIYPKAPEETRAAAVIPVEGSKWMVTAAGYSGDHPPTSPDAFLEFLRTLSQPEIFNKLKDATILGSLKQFKFSAGTRKHYEKSNLVNKGLLAIGDAICSANPFFGQGIAVAAQEAKVLQKSLKQYGPIVSDWPEAASNSYYKKISKILDISWGLAIGEDLKYPSTTGKRPVGFSLTRRIKDRIMSSNEPVVARQFYKVMHFSASPLSLFKLRIIKAVLFGK